MAESYSFVQGSLTLNIDDKTTYTTTEILINTDRPDSLWHTPDFGERKLIRTEDSDRECLIEVAVEGTAVTDEDEVENAVTVLERWMKEAQRHSLTGDNNPVYLKIQKDGATNAVQHLIKDGYVDDRASHFGGVRINNFAAPNVRIFMILAPYGDAETVITMQNRLASSPHFVEWSSGTSDPAYADGWSAFGTPTNATKATTTSLIGGAAQRITTDNSTSEGIRSDVVACSASQDVAAFAWLFITGDPVTVDLIDDIGAVSGATETLQVNDASSVSDKSATGSDGSTWYRMSVSGTTNVGASTIQLRIYRASGNATQVSTFRVDGCYLGLGATETPDAWMSGRRIENRGDVDSSNEDEINYIDIWGVPGDANALVSHRLDFSSAQANDKILIAGQVIDGQLLAAQEIHWLEDDDFTYSITGGITNSQQNDATRTDGHYRRFENTSGVSEGGVFNYQPSGDASRRFFYNPKKVYALIRASSATTIDFEFEITIQSGATVLQHSGEVSVPAINIWYFHELGIINLEGFVLLDPPDTSKPDDIRFTIDVDLNATGTFDLDGVLFLPVTDGHLIVQSYDTFNGNDVHIRGKQKDVVNESSGYAYDSALGSLWTIPPGNIMTRRTFLVKATTGADAITTSVFNTLIITPRTRHLLGTI